MPDYFYKCDGCNRDYHENRVEEHPQIFTVCGCGGNFKLKEE